MPININSTVHTTGKAQDGGESGGDTVVVGDHAVLERYVEVTAAQYLFAGEVDVINGVLVEFHDKNILSV